MKDILDEAIKHAEEVAEKNEKKAKSYPRPDKNVKGSGRKYNDCIECASEHRRLAEWLKELKQLREQTGWIPVSKRLPEKNMACLVAVGEFNLTQMAMYSDLMGIKNRRIFYQGDYGDDSFEDITEYVKAWMYLPKPYKASPTGDEVEE